jgi:type VI secretion system protein ImpA
MLDLVSDYLTRNEPTNPAPLLIDCAKRLMSKSFVEIMRDMGPDGVALIEKIRGTPQK